MSPAVEVHAFQKTDRERVVVSRGEYRGREYTSVWVHWLTPAGDWVPTKKGLTLRSDLVPELEEALRYVRMQPPGTLKTRQLGGTEKAAVGSPPVDSNDQATAITDPQPRQSRRKRTPDTTGPDRNTHPPARISARVEEGDPS